MQRIDHRPVPMGDPAGHTICLVCGGILIREADSWVHWQLPARR